MFSALSSILALLCIGLAVGIASKRTRKPRRPPGPPGYPIIGNVFDMPSAHECYTFAEWRHIYGDLISVNCAGTSIVIMNTYEKAVELLETKSAIYSDRADAPMATDLVGWKDNLAFLQYGSRFREGRKMFHQEFGTPKQLVKFQPQQEDQSINLLRNLLKEPDNLEKIVSDHAGALIMRVAYGYEKQDDELVTLVNHVMECAGLATQPSRFWVNIMPWLKHIPAWVPGAGFQKIAAKWNRDMVDMVDRPFNFVKESLANGTASLSFTSRLLSDEKTQNQEDTIKWLAGSMFAGGSDTTSSTLRWFIVAMIEHPEAQRRAQQEIEAVIGTERLPCFSDRDVLPYVEALVSEIMRYYTLVPIGIPHKSQEDDIHDGYFIPKGSIMLQNIWLMAHDESVYKHPFSFDPTRFMGPNPERDVRSYCFGFGRRACPGKHLADSSIWIACARILAVFNIGPIPGEKFEAKVAPGISSHPEHFECKIEARSEKAKKLVDV